MAYVLSPNTLDRIMRVVEAFERMNLDAGTAYSQTQGYTPRMPQLQLYLGKTLDKCSKNSTAASTFMVYTGPPGYAETVSPTSFAVPIYNHFGDVSSGMWGIIANVNSAFYLLTAESTCST